WLGRRLPDYMLPAGFVRLEALPLTANGKIDRKKLPGVEAGRQPGSVYTVPENEMQQLLLEVWQQVLGLNTIGIHDNFFSIGGNSISMIEIIAKARQQQVEITVRQVFEYPTIAMLAQAAKRKENTAAGQEAVTGAMPLLPIQRWYFEHQQQDVHHFNYAVMLTAPEELTSRRFFALTAALVDKHDALRLRFPHWEEGTAWHEPFSEKLLHSIATVEDYCDFVPVERTALVNTHAAGVQESLSIADGPLCRLVWYNYGAGSPGRLLLVAHHLLVDGISWRLLIDDLNRLLAQASGDQTFIPGGKSDSYKRWAEQLQAYATGERLLMERSYWHAVLNDAVDPFPAGSGTADRSIANQRQLVVGLDQAETRNLVYHCAKAYNTHINDLLLTALMTAICRWGNISSFLVHLEGHGREDIFEGTDVSQTVGWFTSIYPVLLNKGQINLETPHGIGTALRSVKENLRAVPANGLGYGVLRYLAQDADIAACERRRPAAVLFNYLGDFTQARNQAAVAMSESAGNTISGRQHALYSLEFNGAIIDNCLRFAISYLEGEYPVEDTTRLAGCFRQALQEVISHCMAVKRTHFTPSDFPLAALGQEKIDELEESFPEMQEVYPATSMQKAMFFHSLVADDEGAYVVQQHGRLKNIDPALFKLSWSRLVERHSMLRTAFVLCEKNGLLQVVSGRTEVQASYINCRDLSGAAWEAQLAACMEADAQTPFDFEKAPLFRYTILQRDEQDFHILLTLHHIILDGWSMPVLFAELNEVYQALSRQQPVMLPPVPSYGKYVDWLLTRSQAKALEFWKNQGLYAGQVSRLALQEGAASGIQEEGYREWHTVFTTAESSLLKNAAAKYEVTLHTLLVAAWARLLSDYTHAGEVMFGMTISGRSEAFEGISAMVGLFINTIPVKVACPVDEPLQEWLLALHRQQMEYNQYGAVGLSDIRRLNGINQDVPLFESLLVHQNYPGLNSRKKEDNAPAFEFSNAGFRDNNNSPLTIMVFSGQPLSFLINYKTEMFEHGFIENIAADYRKYLIDIARGEEVTINNLKTTW
ncbi:non-ribosomal peptide synthase domain TIGR01720, partial [Chitinophaga eiseniae]